jgi:hypothetical protein
MCESLEPVSSVIIKRFVHEKKQLSEKISTDGGMQIDESIVRYINASYPIRTTLESDSNVTLAAKHVCPSKQLSPRISIQFGMRTSEQIPDHARENGFLPPPGNLRSF